MSDFIERRKITPIEQAVIGLSKDLDSFKKSVKQEFADNSARLDIYIQHSDAIHRQVQDSLQRQLDQNQIQHKDMMDTTKESMGIFRDTMEKFVSAAENRIDEIVERQKEEDVSRNLAIENLTKKVSEIDPAKKALGIQEKLKVAILTSLATFIVMGIAIAVLNFVDYQIKSVHVTQNQTINGVP